MAKAKKTKTETTESEEKSTPTKIIEEGNYSLVMTHDEILTAIQVLSFASAMFEQMAVAAAKDGDDKSVSAWQLRAKGSAILCLKFRDVANIGEPTSREVH